MCIQTCTNLPVHMFTYTFTLTLCPRCKNNYIKISQGSPKRPKLTHMHTHSHAHVHADTALDITLGPRSPRWTPTVNQANQNRAHHLWVEMRLRLRLSLAVLWAITEKSIRTGEALMASVHLYVPWHIITWSVSNWQNCSSLQVVSLVTWGKFCQ